MSNMYKNKCCKELELFITFCSFFVLYYVVNYYIISRPSLILAFFATNYVFCLTLLQRP